MNELNQRERGQFRGVLLSAATASVALAFALWVTRDTRPSFAHDLKRVTLTPERAAENFITAYRSGAFDQAAQLATGELARGLRARYQQGETAAATRVQRFVIQESHRLDDERLRLHGVLAEDGVDEREGTPVSVALRKIETRYLVEEIQW